MVLPLASGSPAKVLFAHPSRLLRVVDPTKEAKAPSLEIASNVGGLELDI